MPRGRIRLKMRVPLEDLRESVMITGFRGFGMVGYLVSWYTALALEAERVGYILTGSMPPGIVVERGDVRLPFELYYSRRSRTLIIVNRAIPEKHEWDDYTEFLAELAAKLRVKYAVLAGGLSREFRPADDTVGYRWLANDHYLRAYKKLEAPMMEEGLGVMGPLALLYMYLDYHEVPVLVLLPYSAVEEADYEAALVGVRVLSELLEQQIDLTMLKEAAEAQKIVMKRIEEMIAEERRGEAEERSFYM